VEQAKQVLDGWTHVAEARAVGDQGRHLDVGVLEQQLDGLHVVHNSKTTTNTRPQP
jgi:hypothetical protein